MNSARLKPWAYSPTAAAFNNQFGCDTRHSVQNPTFVQSRFGADFPYRGLRGGPPLGDAGELKPLACGSSLPKLVLYVQLFGSQGWKQITVPNCSQTWQRPSAAQFRIFFGGTTAKPFGPGRNPRPPPTILTDVGGSWPAVAIGIIGRLRIAARAADVGPLPVLVHVVVLRMPVAARPGLPLRQIDHGAERQEQDEQEAASAHAHDFYSQLHL